MSRSLNVAKAFSYSSCFQSHIHCSQGSHACPCPCIMACNFCAHGLHGLTLHLMMETLQRLPHASPNLSLATNLSPASLLPVAAWLSLALFINNTRAEHSHTNPLTNSPELRLGFLQTPYICVYASSSITDSCAVQALTCVTLQCTQSGCST